MVPFIQQLFNEPLLGAKHSFRHWRWTKGTRIAALWEMRPWREWTGGRLCRGFIAAWLVLWAGGPAIGEFAAEECYKLVSLPKDHSGCCVENRTVGGSSEHGADKGAEHRSRSCCWWGQRGPGCSGGRVTGACCTGSAYKGAEGCDKKEKG